MNLDPRQWKANVTTKQLSLLIILGGFTMLLWGRLLLKEVPRSAVADDESAMASGSDRAKDARDRRLDARPVVYVDLKNQIKRDLFALNREPYRKVEKPAVEIPDEPKSPPQIPDDKSKATAVRDALSQLKLESTVLGTRPIAVINGRSYGPGQKVGDFILVEVRPRSVVLHMHGREVELEL